MKKCSLSEIHDIAPALMEVSNNGFPRPQKTARGLRSLLPSIHSVSSTLCYKPISMRARMETPFCMIFHGLTCPFSYAYHSSGKRIG